MESLWISEVDSVFDITIAFSDGAYVIGQYTSETQANYILDAIEKEYGFNTGYFNSLKVFHMPEDWEAKS